jgi:2,3-bisphosphoglycerate-independent phosphoglycerate mutase
VLKVLYIFIDGVGLRPAAPDNPVHAGNCPALCQLIKEHAVPIDACLEVEGLPQSATGQTAMFTGTNAARQMGRHCEGFPGPTLRRIIHKTNLFIELTRKGQRCCFADAYMIDKISDLEHRRFKSVTTVMALTQPETILMRDDLLENQAVSHDITRTYLVDKGHDLPLVKPHQAAEHLIQVARANDFTLFEFFLTDLAGHSRNYQAACETLSMLDQFIEIVQALCKATNMLLIITSDHGNIENMGTKSHTRNPVPLVATGPGAEIITTNAYNLTQITPRILRVF